MSTMHLVVGVTTSSIYDFLASVLDAPGKFSYVRAWDWNPFRYKCVFKLPNCSWFWILIG